MRTKNQLKKGLKMATNDEPLSIDYTGLVEIYSKIKNKEGIPELLAVLDEANRTAGKKLPFYTFMDVVPSEPMDDISFGARTQKSRDRVIVRDRQIAQRLIDERIINAQGEVIR